MKKILLALALFCFVASVSFAQNSVQKTNKSNKELVKMAPHSEYSQVGSDRKVQELPDDFPEFINTGDAKNDDLNFHNAKQKWIKENPYRYQEIKHLNLNSKKETPKKQNDEK